MMSALKLRGLFGLWQRAASARRALAHVLGDARAAQIAEFALSLPVLVLFVVGIFDFSSALTLKQKLTNAAREGARVAAADPASDLASPGASGPLSVYDAYYIVDSYLISEQINDCGLASAKPTQSGTSLTWTSTASGCGTTSLVLTINRGCLQQESGNATNTVGTCVTISYPYNWRFANVAWLFGGSFSANSSISTTAAAFNEN